MSENILFQHNIYESENFDSISDPVQVPGPRINQPVHNPTTPPQDPNGQATATVRSDIALQADNVLLAQNSISKSLPYMVGFVQPLQTSAGYIFGLQQKERTQIPDASNPGDDIVVIRKFIETQVRQVTLDLTNETAEDIVSLFGKEFPQNYDKLIKSGGVLWDGQNGPLARFFLSLAHQRMTGKINKDFTGWLKTTSFPVGAMTIATNDEMKQIITAISEMRQSLFERSGKNGQLWLITTPKIANFLSTFYQRQHNDADLFNSGKRIPSGAENGYIATIGDIEIYQYPFAVSGTKNEMYMGYRGSAGTASVYYTPYSEYIVQGGEDYFTGQSNVYYRVRDTWETNPLDTYENSITEPALGTTTQPIPNNKSNFIVSANIDVTFKALS